MTRSRTADCLDHMLEAAAQTYGYFEINLETVWETIQTALPTLIEQLPAIRSTLP